MDARLDHLVIAVADLDEAASRWNALGLRAQRGGAHPVGTENVLVRGPQPAYIELIAPGRDESNPWLDRVRSGHGLISWAIAVDDIHHARAALVKAGFDPQPVVEGSRLTTEGDVVAWRLCDVGPGPYDPGLPFLMEWTTPMGAGPADGPILESVALTPPDPERVADLLLALGFADAEMWPRRQFHDPTGVGVAIQLLPRGEPVLSSGAVVLTFDGPEVAEPETSLLMRVAAGDLESEELDGVHVSAYVDHRGRAPSGLLQAVNEAFARLRGDLADWPNPHPGGRAALEEEYSRCLEPARYRLLGVRADAWAEAICSLDLGSAESIAPGDVRWVAESHFTPSRVTVLRGRAGTQPVVVAYAPSDGVEDSHVQIGVGKPTEVLDRQPYCGCDACDTGSADLLESLDAAFILALSGGVYAVREGDNAVTRTL